MSSSLWLDRLSHKGGHVRIYDCVGDSTQFHVFVKKNKQKPDSTSGMTSTQGIMPTQGLPRKKDVRSPDVPISIRDTIVSNIEHVRIFYNTLITYFMCLVYYDFIHMYVIGALHHLHNTLQCTNIL